MQTAAWHFSHVHLFDNDANGYVQVAVPLNGWGREQELEYGLEDCGAKVFICDEERLKRSTPALQKLKIPSILVRLVTSYPV